MGGFGDFFKSAAGPVLDFVGASFLQNDAQSFARHMSNTSHQREVADLRAAGLNPILSATGGPGASTPSSPMATVRPSEAINSARIVKEQVKLLQFQQEKTIAETQRTMEETENTRIDGMTKQAEYDQLSKMEPDIRRRQAESGVELQTAQAMESRVRTLIGELTSARQKLELSDLTKDPVLRRYTLSAEAGQLAQLERLLEQGKAADIVKFLLTLKGR